MIEGDAKPDVNFSEKSWPGVGVLIEEGPCKQKLKVFGYQSE